MEASHILLAQRLLVQSKWPLVFKMEVGDHLLVLELKLSDFFSIRDGSHWLSFSLELKVSDF